MEKHELIEAGQIVSTHGTRGEVRIYPWCDGPEFLSRFSTLYIGSAPFKCSVRPHGGVAIASLEGITDVRSAAALKGETVYFDRADASLEDGRYFVHDLIGLRALDESGSELGRVTNVLNMPSQDVWEITGEKKYLVPAVAAFIKEVNVPEGYTVLHMIEGLEAQ